MSDFSIIPEEYLLMGITYSTFTDHQNYNNNEELKLVCDEYKDSIKYIEMPMITLYKITNHNQLESYNFCVSNYIFNTMEEIYNFINEKLRLYELYIYDINSDTRTLNNPQLFKLRLFIKDTRIKHRNNIITEILDL